jgi:transcriptional regulator with PAS, ATPase and Fis domain
MLIGETVVMHDLRARIARIAQTSFTVLIEGESGVGKELVAREIHATSHRRRGPFVAVNCAALVETLVEAELFGIEDRTATGVRGRRGKFELANGGTLFLDEVADLSPTAQAKLLRVLQDMAVERVGAQTPHLVDVRVLAATNRTLRELVEAGKFRNDLYYRLSGVEIRIAPLRDRRSDIPLLMRHFADRYHRAKTLQFSPAAVEALTGFAWPGNVRQLGRAIERAIALAPGPVITVADLPEEVSKGYRQLMPTTTFPDNTLRAWSSRYVRFVLDRCDGNKRRACDVLDISFHTLKSHLEYDAGGTSADRAEPLPIVADDGRELRSPTAG